MSGKKILIIHKEDQVMREMHNILSGFNFSLAYANDGLHGLYAVESNKPDLIISEIDLPILNGIDLGKMIRNGKCFKDIPIIFLHDKLNLFYINQSKNIGSSAFLIHPYIDNTLIYATKKALQEDNLKVNKDGDPVKYEDCKVPELVKIDRRNLCLGTDLNHLSKF